MTRHARPVILLHWVTALLIVLALVAGKFMLEPLANDDPAKLGALRNHAILGLVLLGLMLARVVVRLSTKAPPPASTGPALSISYCSSRTPAFTSSGPSSYRPMT